MDDDHLQTAEKPFKTFGPLQANLGWQVLFAQPIDFKLNVFKNSM